METQVDLMANGQAQGAVANKVVNGGLNINNMKPFIGEDGQAYINVFNGGDPKKPENYGTRLVNNATLRRDEWKSLDDAVLGVSRYRLGGVQDLIDNGLTYNLGNAFGTTVLEWHDVSDSQEAVMTMDGITRGGGDRPSFKHNYLPIPIIHVDYEINARVLATSRNMGNPLDTTAAESAARRVVEKLENMLFTNTTYSYGQKDERNRNSIYSYVNFPDRIPYALPLSWSNAGKTGSQILTDVLAMKQKSIDNLHYGPWNLYIPTAYEVVLDKDYDSVTPGTTIRERILKIAGIKSIKVIDTLPADNSVLVQMTPDVVRLVRGTGIQNIQWGEEGNMVTKYKVMTIQVPQIRSDANGKSGVVHMA